jgi:uncharacterized protein YdcH (DUF465 family)
MKETDDLAGLAGNFKRIIVGVHYKEDPRHFIDSCLGYNFDFIEKRNSLLSDGIKSVLAELKKDVYTIDPLKPAGGRDLGRLKSTAVRLFCLMKSIRLYLTKEYREIYHKGSSELDQFDKLLEKAEELTKDINVSVMIGTPTKTIVKEHEKIDEATLALKTSRFKLLFYAYFWIAAILTPILAIWAIKLACAPAS